MRLQEEALVGSVLDLSLFASLYFFQEVNTPLSFNRFKGIYVLLGSPGTEPCRYYVLFPQIQWPGKLHQLSLSSVRCSCHRETGSPSHTELAFFLEDFRGQIHTQFRLGHHGRTKQEMIMGPGRRWSEAARREAERARWGLQGSMQRGPSTPSGEHKSGRS